jgi:predicted Fe-Mo cluster-binding NifX family protein
MGQAQYFLVAIIDDAGIIQFETRDKPRHNHESEQGQHEHSGQGMGPTMLAPIADCQVLISGGMGEPAYEHARKQGLNVILPAEKNIQSALDAYRSGELETDPRRIHKH